MIVNLKELRRIKRPVGLVDGCFDPLHAGHIKYLQKARSFGLELFCNLASDEYIAAEKCRLPLLSEKQRAVILNEIKQIAYVHICRTSLKDVLNRLEPDVYFKDATWKDRLPDKIKIRNKVVRVEFIGIDLPCSSTTILKDFITNNTRSSSVKELEAYIELQGNEYKEGNKLYAGRCVEFDEEFSTLIRDVFKPKKVLIVGAMNESDDKEMSEKFDLVICKDILSHLPVRHMRKFISVLAGYTRNHLCVYSRFHPFPEHILDITNGTNDLDISLMNKEFVRALFVLEGMSSLYNFESKLSRKLKNKDRGEFLVFQKKPRFSL